MVIRNCPFVIGSVMYAIICLLIPDLWPLTCTNSYVRKNKPFLTNKANFPESQMNVTEVLTKDYESQTLSERGKNKANSKPNKANLLNAQMNVSTFLTKDYENIANCALAENKPNTKPIQTQSNPIPSRKERPGRSRGTFFENVSITNIEDPPSVWRNQYRISACDGFNLIGAALLELIWALEKWFHGGSLSGNGSYRKCPPSPSGLWISPPHTGLFYTYQNRQTTCHLSLLPTAPLPNSYPSSVLMPARKAHRPVCSQPSECSFSADAASHL